MNSFETKDIESQASPQGSAYTSTTNAFDGYDFIALFFGANYCPFCKEFAPTVVKAIPKFQDKKTKVIPSDYHEADIAFILFLT